MDASLLMDCGIYIDSLGQLRFTFINSFYVFFNRVEFYSNETGGGFFKIPEDQVTLSEGVLEQNPGWGDGTNWAKGDLPYKFK